MTGAVLVAPLGVRSVPASAAAPGSPSTSSAAASSPPTGSSEPVPVYAYFYQWFTTSSWNRAKKDLPLAGKYSSDDPHVLRQQVEQARSAGIDGFLTSWKSTPTLNRRLDLLIAVAHSEHLDLGVVYEALDFNRHPLPIPTVEHDMVYLVTTRGAGLTSAYYGRPVVIWTGTDQYSTADVQSVRAALGDRAYLLAASKTAAGYERIANYVDGEAYYWSSADPGSPATLAKLTAMSRAVHAHHGLWIAPASSGFDGSSLGGTRVIARDNGRTLIHSLDNAFATSPDGVGVISWNEWSENTYIEPGHKYGDQELVALRNYLRDRGRNVAAASPESDTTSAPGTGSGWTGVQAAVTLAGGATVGIVGLAFYRRKRSKSKETGPAPGTTYQTLGVLADQSAGPRDSNGD